MSVQAACLDNAQEHVRLAQSWERTAEAELHHRHVESLRERRELIQQNWALAVKWLLFALLIPAEEST